MKMIKMKILNQKEWEANLIVYIKVNIILSFKSYSKKIKIDIKGFNELKE